jgi:hypothetical protein
MLIISTTSPDALVASAMLLNQTKSKVWRFQFFNPLTPETELRERALSISDSDQSKRFIGMPLIKDPCVTQVSNLFNKELHEKIIDGSVLFANDSLTSLAFKFNQGKIPEKNLDSFRKAFNSKTMHKSSLVKFCSNAQEFFSPFRGTKMKSLYVFMEETFPSLMSYARTIEVISRCEFDLDLIVKTLECDESISGWVSRARKSSKCLTFIGKELSILHQPFGWSYPKYCEALHGDCKYFLRISQKNNNVSIVELEKNPWSSSKSTIDKLDFGFVGSKYDNYFHGVIDKKDTDAFVDYVLNKLNQEYEMEKLGVDETDPIEESAKAILTENKAKTMVDARALAVKEKDDKDLRQIEGRG